LTVPKVLFNGLQLLAQFLALLLPGPTAYISLLISVGEDRHAFQVAASASAFIIFSILKLFYFVWFVLFILLIIRYFILFIYSPTHVFLRIYLYNLHVYILSTILYYLHYTSRLCENFFCKRDL